MAHDDPNRAQARNIRQAATVWLAQCEDVFNGYGVTAIGRTEAEAKAALYAEYATQSRRWNNSADPHHPDYDSLADYVGVHLREMRLGVGYFGDADIHTHA